MDLAKRTDSKKIILSHPYLGVALKGTVHGNLFSEFKLLLLFTCFVREPGCV
jgi:hypothetical protein